MPVHLVELFEQGNRIAVAEYTRVPITGEFIIHNKIRFQVIQVTWQKDLNPHLEVVRV